MIKSFAILSATFLLVVGPAFLSAGAVVQGKVVDGAGASVVEATVFLNQDRRVRTCVSGQDGAYRFEDVEVELMELTAYKLGYAVGGHTATPLDDMEIPLVLLPAGRIEVRVIDQSFLPTPGARVTVMMVNDQFLVSVEDLTASGFPMLRSNDEGLLTIPLAPEGGFVKLTLAHHRYADSNIAYLPADGRRRDVILYEGAQLRGRVTAEGKPLAGARVSLFQMGVGGQRKFAEALSDPEGYYRLRAPEDAYLVAARHPDHASAPPISVELRDREVPAVADIELPPPFVVHGAVVLPDGKPCPGARVLFRVENAIFDDALSDRDGNFTLRVGSAEGVLRVLPPPGFMTEMLSDTPISFGEVRETRLQPIRLVELPVIRGRLLTPEDAAPTHLYLRSLDLPTPIHAVSELDGSFELRLMYQPDQEIVTFRAEHPLRFLRRDFKVNLTALGALEMMLDPFEPNLERLPHEPGRNNLEALLGEPAPEIQCSDWFNTQPLTLNALQGRVAVVTFWGGFDDSPFAVNRLIELRVVHDLFRDVDDVLVWGVHDASSEPDEIEEYLHRYEINFPVGRDADPFVSFVNYGINFIPQTVLIDKQGRVQYVRTEGRLLELIKDLRRR